jgi:hypothetical protein
MTRWLKNWAWFAVRTQMFEGRKASLPPDDARQTTLQDWLESLLSKSAKGYIPDDTDPTSDMQDESSEEEPAREACDEQEEDRVSGDGSSEEEYQPKRPRLERFQSIRQGSDAPDLEAEDQDLSPAVEDFQRPGVAVQSLSGTVARGLSERSQLLRMDSTVERGSKLMDLVRPPTSTSSERAAALDPGFVWKMGSSRDDQTAAAQDQSRREDLSMGLTARTGAGGRTISRQASRAAELLELLEAIATARLNWETESRHQQEEEDEKLLAAAREELRQILEATAEIRARRSGSGAIQPRRASEPIPAAIRSFSPIDGGRGEEELNVRRAMDPGSGERWINRTNRVPASFPRGSPITTGHLRSIASNLAPNQLPIAFQESSGQPTMHMVSLTNKDNPELKSLDTWSVDHFLSGRKHNTATTTARKINPGINIHVTRIFLEDKAAGKIPTEYAAHDQLPDDLFRAMIYRNLPQTHGSLATSRANLVCDSGSSG